MSSSNLAERLTKETPVRILKSRLKLGIQMGNGLRNASERLYRKVPEISEEGNFVFPKHSSFGDLVTTLKVIFPGVVSDIVSDDLVDHPHAFGESEISPKKIHLVPMTVKPKKNWEPFTACAGPWWLLQVDEDVINQISRGELRLRLPGTKQKSVGRERHVIVGLNTDPKAKVSVPDTKGRMHKVDPIVVTYANDTYNVSGMHCLFAEK